MKADVGFIGLVPVKGAETTMQPNTAGWDEKNKAGTFSFNPSIRD